MPQVRLPRPIGYVMGGGASLGSVQVGMLLALRDAGVSPDFVVGTSAGALNGAILAADPEGAPDRLHDIWLEMQRSDIFTGNLLSAIWRLRRTRTHAMDTDGLQRLAAKTLQAEAFDDLALDFATVAVDVLSGNVRVIDSGRLLPALLASAAIPGVFAPVQLEDQLLVDGGVLAMVPVGEAYGFRRAGSLVVLDCAVPQPSHPVESVGDLIVLTTRLQNQQQLGPALSAAAREVPVLSMPAPGAHQVSPFEFGETSTLIDETHRAGAAFLADVKVEGAGVYGDPWSRYRRAVAPQAGSELRPADSVVAAP